MDEGPGTPLDELRPVVDFMRQQYWHVYDPAERRRMLAALAAVSRAEDTEPPPETDAPPLRVDGDGVSPVGSGADS
jgi:hypothetical protein